LVLAREEEGGGERWRLGDVAKGVVKSGRSAWDRSGQRPEGYFLVLILVGEYERVRFSGRDEMTDARLCTFC
jgi:hypothetical protein